MSPCFRLIEHFISDICFQRYQSFPWK